MYATFWQISCSPMKKYWWACVSVLGLGFNLTSPVFASIGKKDSWNIESSFASHIYNQDDIERAEEIEKQETKLSDKNFMVLSDPSLTSDLAPESVADDLIASVISASAERELQDYISNSRERLTERNELSKGGSTQFASFGSSILAAFSLTLVTEVGDRTFFVAALLAAQYCKWRVWLGAVAALWTQTIACALLGSFFHSWQFKSAWLSWPVDDYLAGIVLAVFGIIHMRESLLEHGKSARDCEALEISPSSTLLERHGSVSRLSTASDKRRSSAVSNKQVEQARQTLQTNTLAKNQSSIILHSFWLVLVAELGDRSMFSTTALAAAQNPVGVAIGASFGHALVTCAAVTCAALLGQFLNEWIINIFGGLLFVAFGVLSLTEGLVRQGVF
eukprot:Gregarina_sp_Poly_1__4298@NODE_2336_length_2262_cov_101_148519_g1492_i0_p1_GENE_NODE_2336_length_2262_cov_101_148519_g1492_i0NODE_2336_length_2262_cov_101_148519_g1492_i0_p1_ORF_typecomplete_len391_score40_24UPF0016/PF01169_19/1_5e14UPF0016/PF01169_19/2_3e20DUF3772/PF12607_8/8_2e03DUF3772/PF12607_8/0_013DUF2783/PF10932_8/26DUF2783/PF10932_8/6_1NicO/PF03824_16/3_3e02NicO/PF03824_16/0_15_NODE_2336_length_2262_cov_101_148519_g1492_i01861358